MRVQAKLFFALLLTGISSSASTINFPDVTIGADPYRAFQDTRTNLIWLDLDNFFEGYSYDTIIALLTGSDYHLATQSELEELQISLPAVPAYFMAHATVIGANYPGSPFATGTESIAWGIFEDGDPSDSVGWAWKYSSDTSWNTVTNQISQGQDFSSVEPIHRDLGAWIVSNNPFVAVPEPGTFALLGGTLIAAMAMRRSSRR